MLPKAHKQLKSSEIRFSRRKMLEPIKVAKELLLLTAVSENDATIVSEGSYDRSNK